ncbi:antibiotic biosynthesis monooxygenase [Cognatishimia sp. SS12]|uniref:putative quinol monooxygenase n=1 Tax=Cognatishimia sp. SS12 TaxID=2979465 RepID=UPI00232AF590|nr:antibiotic biosynthesis monooxygenase [Cognatishimia sp. SS12]MDC0738867.1 antibiotic biosynthesis monooxygenase [Cognatishimia sp. SS12]
MLIAIVDIPLTPDSKPAARAALEQVLPDIRRQPGNLGFRILSETDTSPDLTLLQEWQSESAFAAYLASPLFKGLGAALAPLMSGPPNSRRFVAEALAPAE